MDIICADFLVENNALVSCEERSYVFDPAPYNIYEVIRVIGGTAIFLEDHLERMKMSAKLLGNCPEDFDLNISELLLRLINQNKNREGNIKLVGSSHARDFRFAAYYIPHVYPRDDEYRMGVKLLLHQISRPDPNLKQVAVSDSIRGKLNEIFNTTDMYETLLLNENYKITEGSKSNFFLIKNNSLYTAPDHLVLKGITRKYVLQIAQEMGIECMYKEILPEELQDYEAAFICGTSPKILPVRQIDSYIFDPENILMKQMMEQYDRTITSYIESKK